MSQIYLAGPFFSEEQIDRGAVSIKNQLLLKEAK